MSVISFWNAMEKENGQTLSILALATYMAVEHNYKILVVDTTFNDKTIEKAFWKRKKENKSFKELTGGKMDISSGAEGLISAVASNKATPEIVINYTKIVFKNRLDILLGLKTQSFKEYKSMASSYKDLIVVASKYYDMIFVDLPKGLGNPDCDSILKFSNLILYTMPPNLANIDLYNDLKEDSNSIVSSLKVMPLLARSDESSSYNVRNTTKYVREKAVISTVPYNVRFMEATNESRLADFMTKVKLSKASFQENENFFEEIARSDDIILKKLKELIKLREFMK